MCIDVCGVVVLIVFGMLFGLIIVLVYDVEGNLWIGMIEGICVLCGNCV